MRKIYAVLISLIITTGVFAQAPEKMSYQAVVRNSSNQLVVSKAVGMRISILQNSDSGTEVYAETQTPTTNTNGLVTIEIGSGTVVSGAFSSINWSVGTYFIKTEIDPAGGNSYSITGVSQLLSVPFALHAKKADSYTETDPFFSSHPANALTSADMQNWNAAYSWGNHTALYKPIAYVPAWGDVTNNPFNIASPANNQMLKYNSAAAKWENWTPDFITAEVDGSVTNEIQTLTLNTNQLSISGTGGNSVTFTNWDTDKTDDVTLTSPTSGDMLYYTGTNWTSIPKGTEGQVLTMGASGNPVWKNAIQIPPSVTKAATFNTATSPVTAILNASVNANNLPTIVTFEYGTTISYGNSITAVQSPVSSGSATNVSINLTSLTPGTAYHFRVKTQNALGVSYGEDMTFQLLGLGLPWAGGFIFYLDASGMHGLVAATADQSIGAPWGCNATEISGADGTVVGAGNQNTIDIENGCTTAGTAADICANLVEATYDDWFLPSIDELQLMYTNLRAQNIGGFGLVNYWSSTEKDASNGWKILFSTNSKGYSTKSNGYYIRAARAF
ncbi:Lcl domain-containing protein [Williamwhitmania taraxaci]|uniref:Fibronectin type-III domain-containing protein n=1 Tax=Williamwhitmania taraxaci TaxID=1640674 RepID=A0A1G6T3U6_9BACT|nr:DUF1566 domain-containing protein [Williamwhitmania taraxaci]SDD23691.1 Protein of unknown function [Williamwhitmania taraxaci]